jgi:hypothetical protein
MGEIYSFYKYLRVREAPAADEQMVVQRCPDEDDSLNVNAYYQEVTSGSLTPEFITEVSQLMAAENRHLWSVFSPQAQGCLDASQGTSPGVSVYNENITLDSYVSTFLMGENNPFYEKYLGLPAFTPQQRYNFVTAMEAAYRVVAQNTDFHHAFLSAPQTSVLKDVILERSEILQKAIPELKQELRSDEVQLKQLLLQTNSVLKKASYGPYNDFIAQETARIYEEQSALAAQAEVEKQACLEELDNSPESRYQTSRDITAAYECEQGAPHFYGDSPERQAHFNAGARFLCSPVGHHLVNSGCEDGYFDTLDSILNLGSRWLNNAYSNDVADQGRFYYNNLLAFPESYKAYLPEGYLESQMTQINSLVRNIKNNRHVLPLATAELSQLKPVALDLSQAGQRLPLMVPSVHLDDDGILWEGDVRRGVTGNIQGMLPINMLALLEKYKIHPEIFTVPDYSLNTLGDSFQEDLGLGSEKTVYIRSDVSRPKEELVTLMKDAVASLSVSEDKDGYFAGVGKEVREVHVVSQNEIRAIWLAGLQTKISQVGDNLYSNPLEAKKVLADIEAGLAFNPQGIYQASTRRIYLCERADIADVFPHELSHAAYTALSRAGIIPEEFWSNTVDPIIYDHVLKDYFSFSNHAYVKQGLPQGAEELRTDALKAYWQNPDVLEGEWRGFFKILEGIHSQTTYENVLVQERVVDEEGNVVQEEVREQQVRLIPQNPFTASQQNKEEIREQLYQRF